jgi:hypothetical protein
MGGQACIAYGAAEFSRDTDVVLLAEPDNLDRLRNALQELNAEVIAIPPLELDYLRRGHAVHFRCGHPDAPGMRLDVMSVLRGVDPFPALWERRTTVQMGPNDRVDMLSLPDLVCAKKTQRDKDWPMIRRLVEADCLAAEGTPTSKQIDFWLLEARTPSLLRALLKRFPERARALQAQRPVLAMGPTAADARMEHALRDEEDGEREADRRYWAPLRAELEALRHAR